MESEYIINALDAETNLVVAQLPIPEKINEMGAIPKLLEILDITGSTVTIDAIGATEAILHRIQEKEGFFVQQIKKNCPATWQEIQDTFGKLGEEREELPFIRSIASSCQVRIPKETDENGNDVTQDKETFLKQGSRKSS